MLLICSVGIVVAVVAFICVAVWYKRITSWGIVSLGAVGIGAGLVVTDLPDISGLIVRLGEKKIYSLELQKTAQQVRGDTEEVRQMKEQIEALVKRVEEGEQNVSTMRENVRQAYQSLFESFAYMIGTRNLHPPPPSIDQEIRHHVNLLARFAHPDPEKRREAILKVMEKTRAAQEERGAIPRRAQPKSAE